MKPVRQCLRRAVGRKPGGDLISKENGHNRSLEQEIHGSAGDNSEMGVPAGHGFCVDWCGLLRQAYSWGLAGVKRNPT